MGQSCPLSDVRVGVPQGNAARLPVRDHRSRPLGAVPHQRLAALQQLLPHPDVLLHRWLHGRVQVCTQMRTQRIRQR